jgi:pimeloyl-ACP methyl ester carboxylesterase
MLPLYLTTVLGMALATPEPAKPQDVRIPITAGREIDLTVLIARLAEATGLAATRSGVPVTVPITGPAGALSLRLLGEMLAPDATLEVQGQELVARVDPAVVARERLPAWHGRLESLAAYTRREADRRTRYGMRAMNSYRPNDPARPTVCLVHGLNSSSQGFVHMIRPLEEAGYGVVVFDYAFNQALEESCKKFSAAWREFRQARRETRPWAILAHSMGALVARSYVEDPAVFGGDVCSLILIAPVNQGSSMAKAQSMRQWLTGLQVFGGRSSTEALAYVADGLGEAAADLLPGSAFLTALNARPRAPHVPYHILSGDAGFVPLEGRRRIEAQIQLLRAPGGLLAGLTRLIPLDVPSQLDELCEGTGDGCVSVVRTRLEGVTDHVTIHANHAELIRAPLFFADPGPVVCMPYVVRWLRADAPPAGP